MRVDYTTAVAARKAGGSGSVPARPGLPPRSSRCCWPSSGCWLPSGVSRSSPARPASAARCALASLPLRAAAQTTEKSCRRPTCPPRASGCVQRASRASGLRHKEAPPGSMFAGRGVNGCGLLLPGLLPALSSDQQRYNNGLSTEAMIFRRKPAKGQLREQRTVVNT